jgi:hypothetical protein
LFDSLGTREDNEARFVMKKVLVFIAVVGLSASLGAQSVAELAKRERARRESLKGRHAVVIRNRDLLLVRKAPAIEIAANEAEVNLEEAEGQDVEPVAVPEESVPEGRHFVPRVEADGPVLMGEAASNRVVSSTRTLEAQLRAATDLVDLLTTKINALRQQFEYQDAMVPGYVIQQQLDETNQRLVKAQAQQARIQAEVNKNNSGKKAPGDVER